MAKRKIGEVIWLALQYAKSERESIIDAWGGDKSEEAVKDALADIHAFEKLQIKLFGTSKSELQSMMDKMTSKSVFELLDEEIQPE